MNPFKDLAEEKPIGHRGEVCPEWLAEGRIIVHEFITDDGETYFCSQCSVMLKKEKDHE